MFYGVVSAMSGERFAPRRSAKVGAPEPYGVLVAGTEPAAPEVADLLGEVVGSGAPRLLGMAWAARDAALAERRDNGRDGHALTRRGRELDALERETATAELRAHLRELGEDAVVEDSREPQRWMRGRIERCDGGVDVDVNSQERLERFVDVLRKLDERPRVSATLVIDPSRPCPSYAHTSCFPSAGPPTRTRRGRPLA
jgi:hypothetical protein